MGNSILWKLFSIILLYFVYGLSFICLTAVAVNVLDESESDTHESFEQPMIWSSILEELTIK